jgi:hypothetical protein
LQQSALAPERPLDTCVILDPNNTVTEEGEEIEWMAYSYCPPLPDLIITDAEYDAPGDRLLVTVQNVGEAPLEHRNVSLVVTLADSSTLSDRPVWRSDVTVERVHRTTLELTGIGEEQRARMAGGYTVTVDPLDSIAETDEGNNDYVVRASARLRLAWSQFNTHYYPLRRRSDNTQEQTVTMEVSVVPKATQGRRVAEWTVGPLEVDRGFWEHFSIQREVEFDIAGDEWLTVFADLSMHYQLSTRYLSWGALSLGPDEELGVDRTISPGEECGGVGWTNNTIHTVAVQPPTPWQSCGRWEADFVVCRVE